MAKSITYDSATEDEIKRKLDYNPEDGLFHWLEIRPVRLGDNYYNTRYSGKPAGTTHGNGYLYISINYKTIRAHRIAWFISNGSWPEGEIDHINHIRDDNRLCNLRIATRSEQMRNRKRNKNNTSGVNGVRWHKGAKKWYVDIRLNGPVKYLGSYDDIETAIKVRKDAERAFGYSTTHGAIEEDE